MTIRWLTPEELRAWRSYIAASWLLEDAIDRQLQRDAGMPHLYYSVLANLSDAPGHCMRMTDLAETLKITRSRLTYVVTRLEKDGTVRREACRTDKRGSVAILTSAGLALLERAAPGHVETVRESVFGNLTPEQVGQLEEICARITAGLQADEERSGCGGLPWRRRSSGA